MRSLQLDALGSIQFFDVPDGEVPLHIGMRWIGATVRCLFRDDADDTSFELVSGERSETRRSVYVVLQSDAIEALAEESPEAARWWVRAGYPLAEYPCFSFNAECAEPVTPVLTKAQFLALHADA